ncbi:MAG TPA: WcaI family glycosyltransferase [Pseudosphingobacterium sp.]|nr:WcaI family glycosyltransferase [Pseudosphingobacterium sp.]
MKILIFGINYYPELTGIGKYTGEMGAWLANKGHEVTVITAPPYYPEWDIHPSYKGKKWFKEIIDGVTVYRVPLYVPKEVTSKKRILHEFSFLGGVFPKWFGLLLKKKCDVVININPPFHLGFFGLLYAKIKKAKLLTHVQDLQIDAAKDLGMISNKRLLDWMFKSERYLLNNSHAVSSISLGMQRKILAKGVSEAKFIMFPNWVDENVVKPLSMEDSLRKDWSIPLKDKVVLYSGNLGEKQGLEIILETAEFFRDEPSTRFLIVGSGGNKENLQKAATQRGLTNIFFYPLQPYEKLSALLATADIHLVLQKKSAADLVMPSKLTGIFSAGGCALITAMPNTSLYDVVDGGSLGVLVEPESAEALARGLKMMFDQDLSNYRNAARDYAIQYLSKEGIMRNFEGKLLELVREKKNDKKWHYA